MQLLEDGIIAALAAVGLVTILFLLISTLVRPRRKGTLNTIAVVPCRGGDCAKLEQTVRMLERTRYEYGGFTKIVILDCDMDEDAEKIAALLCHDSFDVTLCKRGEIQKELE